MQKVVAMKSSDVQKRLDLNRNRRSRRPGLNEAERTCRILEIKPLRPFKEHSSEALRHSTNLPPISKPRTVAGKVGSAAAAQPLQRKESAQPKRLYPNLADGNRMKENTLFHVTVTQRGRPKQESNKYKKISVAVQDSETCCRLIKEPQLEDTLVQQRRKDPCENRGTMPGRPEPGASLCEPRQQGFCSDDSAAETLSEDSEDGQRPEGLQEDSDDEYYTDQRITEWVLRVNSSLFLTENDLQSSDPAEEQDVAAIKIICSRD